MTAHAPSAFPLVLGPGYLEVGAVGRAFGLSKVYGVGPAAVAALDGVTVEFGSAQLTACDETGQETPHPDQGCGKRDCRGTARAVRAPARPGTGMTDLNADHYPQRRDRIQHLDRMWRHLANQDTARSNAAQASTALRKRRHDREEVDAYLTDSVRSTTLEAKSDGSSG